MLTAWTQMFGLLSFELFGQTRGLIDDHEAFFREAATVMGSRIGLRDHLTRRLTTALTTTRQAGAGRCRFAGDLELGGWPTTKKFRMGRLDHVHIRVPDRDEAAAWYARHLGFEPVEQFDFWATRHRGWSAADLRRRR